MRRLTRSMCVLAVWGLVVAEPASARNTFHDLDAKRAMTEGHGHENLLDVPVYLKGQALPPIAKDLGVFRSNRRTNASNKSDEKGCEIAFLSALIALQSRAKQLGADAVVDVRSITKHRDLESATQYRCVAGAVVANVALEARLVTFAK